MTKKYKHIASGLVIIIVILLLLLIINRSPKFPDNIPSSDKINVEAENYLEQKTIFNQYTKYIRDNHGGLLIAEESKRIEAVQKESRYQYTQFRQRYKFFDSSLVFYLTKNFSKQEVLEYKIKQFPRSDKNFGAPKYQIEFLKNTNAWVIVIIEIVGDEVKQYEEFTKEAKQDLTEKPESPKIKTDRKVSLSEDISGKLAIIIDDIGYSMKVVNKLIQLDYNLTFSILPNLINTEQSAELIKQRNRQILLHLPMQPKDWPKLNPGPGALYINDSTDDLIKKLEENIASVKYAVGANNHMGSAFTKDRNGLAVVMQVLSQHNLFFIDSKTAPGKTSYKAALQYQVPYLSRNIFLDNEQNESAITKQLNKAVNIAKRNGQAIVIGHPYISTYKVLERHLPTIAKNGIKIVSASQLFYPN
ncbi:MAG: divergent polysaccharide deacetylase family protein [Deltaproteobacteria bacterium]|jgi:polysaccharide deacetylase 2 family uncharacterized protein YibQ|nr:divergent polysaccharide deacetylase family protein [Deltaproteobacteria bacterium]MBT4527735.1 divergent polysaccharide deacetylase family protein [Deltaproteobacteria bacterium]